MGRPLHEISLGRLLQQLFQITEAFEMETQPQLLLLQKTLLMAEGMGRRLDPTVNMWTLSQPLIEEWMRDHRGPEARVAGVLADVGDAALRLPRVLVRMEALLEERALGPMQSPSRNRSPFKQWQFWLIVAATGWGAFFPD